MVLVEANKASKIIVIGLTKFMLGLFHEIDGKVQVIALGYMRWGPETRA